MVARMSRSAIPPGARLAAVDIGTNSVLLTVAGRGPGGRLAPVHDSIRVCRLGQGIARNAGNLSGEAVARTLACLRELRIEARAHGAARILAAGTEVLRVARNAPEFLRDAHGILESEVEVLSGEREARLSWLGVTGGRYPSKPTALLDVGGGSTEYVRATTRGVLQAMTVPIGAATLGEAIAGGDPAALSRASAEALVGAGLIAHPKDRLVTSGGTATTLAAILKGVRTFDQRRIEGTRLGMADVLGLMNRLWSMEPEERARLPGMDPERADTIVPGAVILAVALKLLDARETVVTTRGLRHGILIEAFGMTRAEEPPAAVAETADPAAPPPLA
jgi:exopolyphosphatase/guanosine-5'-triphosphate,3'-diphosphate pyrophosphatase